jgi:hypothetical protein
MAHKWNGGKLQREMIYRIGAELYSKSVEGMEKRKTEETEKIRNIF